MTMPADGPPPSPELFFETSLAFQRTAALRTAVELDLFTAVAAGAGTPAEIAERCGAAERGVRILSDYLTIYGFLTKTDGRYAATTDTAFFLSKSSPAYLGGTLRFLAANDLVKNYGNLAEIVRAGALPEADGTTGPDHPVWVEFARAMVPMMAMPAERIAGIVDIAALDGGRVLDIAAGHGIFGITLAKHNPRIEVVALDWKAVLEVASENARAAGVADRHTTIPGSAFEVDYGSDYALILLTNFLHHFDTPTNVTLLKKVRAALGPGGRAVILEMVPNDDRVTPPMAAAFAMTMLGSTPAGDAYTFSEIERMRLDAGFAGAEAHPLEPGFHNVVVGRT